jgi:hypothetical protein
LLPGIDWNTDWISDSGSKLNEILQYPVWICKNHNMGANKTMGILKNHKVSIIICSFVILVIFFITLRIANTDSVDENIYPSKTTINAEVTQDIKKNLLPMSFLELSFDLDELLKLLHEDMDIRKVWIYKVRNYFTIYYDESSYLTTDKEILFFYGTLENRDDLIARYPDEVAFLKKYRVDTKGRTYLMPDGYAEKMKIYNGNNDNFIELSGLYYDLLIMDGLNFVNKIRNDEKALEAFRLWIKNIRTEFVTYSAPTDTEIIERKRVFLLRKYENCQDPLILEAIKYIKDVKIRIVK